MSLKSQNVTIIPLTAGGTISLDNGSVTLMGVTTDELIEKSSVQYLIGGTQALTSNFIVAMTSPADNTVVDIYWRARATPGAFTVTILGQVIPAEYLGTDFTMKFISFGGSFALLEFNLDFTKGGQLPANRLVNASVGTAQVTDKAITYAKIQDVAAHSVPVRASGTSGVLANLAMAANSIIARVAGDIVNLAAATNGHVLKLTGGALGFAQVNFNELAGTVANTQIPNNEIAAAKLAATLRDEVIIIPVSFDSGDQCDNRFKMPFAGTVTEIYAVVTNALSGSGDGTIVAKDGSGAVMANGTITFSPTAALETEETVVPTTNNVFSAGDILRLTTDKSAGGGKSLVSVKVTRS